MPDSQFASYPSLKGMPVVVSGGASGIGEAIVRAFAAQHSKVGFVDIAEEQGRRLESELRAAGQRVRFVPCDITDVSTYKAAIARLEEEHGATLALVNNAADDKRYPTTRLLRKSGNGRLAAFCTEAMLRHPAGWTGLAPAAISGCSASAGIALGTATTPSSSRRSTLRSAMSPPIRLQRRPWRRHQRLRRRSRRGRLGSGRRRRRGSNPFDQRRRPSPRRA